MLLTSYEFLAFFAVCFLLYYILPKRMQWAILLVGSYVFYFLSGGLSGDGFDWGSAFGFVLLLLSISSVTYFSALFIDRCNRMQREFLEGSGAALSREEKKAYRARNDRKKHRLMLAGLLIALIILGVFKYADFVIDNVNFFVWNFNEDFELGSLDLLLPMGISFYTFQSLGYLLDVYWEKTKPQTNFPKYLLFVSFFPQLVQGPISRYSRLAQSLYEEHSFDWRNIKFGFERILWGFFKKLVVADTILVAVQTLCDDEYYNGAWVLVGMIFYGIELYADFTGGIDITIGVAQSLGIQLEENFIRPYFSKGIIEYWRRWHISMGTWFRDYIFYPMSISDSMNKLTRFCRNRFGRGAAKRVPVYLATMVTWFATGVWHGASWNFIMWGVMNGVIIILTGELEPLYRKFHARFPKLEKNSAYKLFQIIRTFFLMGSLRLFDCYGDVPFACSMFFSMFRDFDLTVLTAEEFSYLGLGWGQYLTVAFGTVLMLAVSLAGRTGSVREKISRKPYAVRFALFALLFLSVLTFGAYGVGYDSTQFIYNQF